MKAINEQIKFIDTALLPLFGLKNIIDYNNFIKCEINEKDEKEFLIKINNILTELKCIFPVKRFNLHKTDNTIKSYKQAINILKMCLEIANVNYILDKFNNDKIVRLNSTNLNLYRYIEKMEKINETSDLRIFRENTNSIIKSTECINKMISDCKTSTDGYKQFHESLLNPKQTVLPGTKEAYKIYHEYTNQDLHKQIKTANTIHIQLCLRHFIKNFNGKQIFELPLILTSMNNIYSIKFKPNDIYDLKKNKIVDKYYILENGFGYLIDGDFDFYKNLIPNNIIIPLNLSIGCFLNLYIPLDINNGNRDLIESLIFEIELGEPVFYKPFQEKLLNEKDCFLLQYFDVNNSKTLLYDFNQKNFIVQKDDKILEIKINEDNDSIMCIENIEYKVNKMKIGDLEGYETPYIASIEKPNLLWILIAKRCAFVKTTLNYSVSISKYNKYIKTSIFSYKTSKYNHILRLSLNRYFDSISNLYFSIRGGITKDFIDKLKINCIFEKINDKPIYSMQLNIKEKVIEDKEGKIPVLYIEDIENKQLNLLNNYGIELEFNYESSNSTNILEDLYIVYDVYVYDCPIRRSLSKLEYFFKFD